MRQITRRVFVRSSLAAGFGITFLKRAGWAAESAKDPPRLDLPITDSHVHFWDPALLEYG